MNIFTLLAIVLLFAVPAAMGSDTYTVKDADSAVSAKNVEVQRCRKVPVAVVDDQGNAVEGYYSMECDEYNLDMLDNQIAPIEAQVAELQAQIDALKAIRAEVSKVAESKVAKVAEDEVAKVPETEVEVLK